MFLWLLMALGLAIAGFGIWVMMVNDFPHPLGLNYKEQTAVMLICLLIALGIMIYILSISLEQIWEQTFNVSI